MRKEILQKKIDAVRKQIEQLEKKEFELCLTWILTPNKETGERYEASERVVGRGKKKKIVNEGRYYWMQKFECQDTGKPVMIERSRPVCEDGVWDEVAVKTLVP